MAASIRYLSFINVFLGIYNLLTGFPMDGGRVLRSIIWKLTGNLRKATTIASSVGQGLAYLFIVIGFIMMFRGLIVNGIWIMMIGWFLLRLACQGYHKIVMREMLSSVRAEDLMERDIQSIPSDLTIQKLVYEFILKHPDRAFIVVDNGGMKGIVCLEDVKKAPTDQWLATTVSKIMISAEELATVSPDDDGNKVLAELAARSVHQVPFVEDGKLRGIVCRTDILQFMQLRSDLGSKGENPHQPDHCLL
jgi:predicted transcriptional regulator